MVVAEGNGSQPYKTDKEEKPTTSATNKGSRQDNSSGSKSIIKITEENDNEKVEVDEFGRMLRRDSRQRDDDYEYSDHSDHDRYKSESRRYSSSSIRSSEDHYESRSNGLRRAHKSQQRDREHRRDRSRNDHGRQLHYDRYVPKKSNYHRHSDSDREDYYRLDDDRIRDRKRARTWSRRSSDSEEEIERRRSGSGRRRRSLDRIDEPEGRRWSYNSFEDPYQAASKYIDTEFYTKKIYVGELKEVTERTLHMAFERFGDIEKIDMIPEKGIAFIDFDSEENATEARRKMHGTLLGSGCIQVNRAKRPERNTNGFGNVPWSDADGAVAKQNDIKPITYEIQYSFPKTSYVNGPSDYTTTVNRSVTMPPPQLPLDPRAQGHKRKIIAYDDL
ncbi:11396_t:CDS:2 [Funneliformis geosporum]|uniref:7756_t:CDS:1 n=1 Tax=Funneliformis geosporum TaxID=1117311 RepID=A0A9W4WME9_9GLOM|nr:11396_t:CDS:2 [Funneliformis geosporum]CAI2164764.1 7756_t:CDS:2 [Funneliformis geosporum]